MKKPILIATLSVLGGCAASYTEPNLSSDHPANPAAEQAPPPTRWRTLDLADADPVAPAPAAGGMDHSGHGMGDNAEPKPVEPGMEGGGHKHEAPAPTPAAAVMYACPMHPEVTSDKPDQRCPKCNMKLEPVPKTGGAR